MPVKNTVNLLLYGKNCPGGFWDDWLRRSPFILRINEKLLLQGHQTGERSSGRRRPRSYYRSVTTFSLLSFCHDASVFDVDFNIAAVMGPDVRYAAAISGTKPYMGKDRLTRLLGFWIDSPLSSAGSVRLHHGRLPWLLLPGGLVVLGNHRLRTAQRQSTLFITHKSPVRVSTGTIFFSSHQKFSFLLHSCQWTSNSQLQNWLFFNSSRLKT